MRSLLRADFTTQWRNRKSFILILIVPVIILISWKGLVDKLGGAFVLANCITVGLTAIGLMDRGRLIRYDTPAGMKSHMEEVCYEVVSPQQRVTKATLQSTEGVVSVEPSGATLHLFLDPAKTSVEALKSKVPGAEFRPITPSLEDVFIALVHKGEK